MMSLISIMRAALKIQLINYVFLSLIIFSYATAPPPPPPIANGTIPGRRLQTQVNKDFIH